MIAIGVIDANDVMTCLAQNQNCRNIRYEDNVLYESRNVPLGATGNPEDGIIREMESRLRSKKVRQPSSADEQYRQMWSIVFPDDQEVQPPRAYHNFSCIRAMIWADSYRL